MNTEKLNGKDLINVGIFTAIYLVVYIAVSCAMGIVPITALFMNLVSSAVLGIPMMIYMSKINKFGMLTLTYLIGGLAMILFGVGCFALPGGVIAALIGEYIIASENYRDIKKNILAYAVCCVGSNANVLYWVIGSERFLKEHGEAVGQEYMDTVLGYFARGWVMPLIMLSSFAGGIIGGYIGSKAVKKHFERSGLL